MHVDQIKDVAVSPNGRRIATASDDKTIRLWDLATGAPLKTYRIPIGEGDEGLLFTTAFAPNDRFVLAGGLSGLAWDDRIYLYFFEQQTGKLRFKFPIPGAIQKISYFPKVGDPKYLAIAYASTNQRGVMVVDTKGERPLDDVVYERTPTWVEFGPNGELVAVAEDGYIRLYSPDLELIGRQKLPHDTPQPSMARFTPLGSYVAVGYYNARSVDVLATNDLSLQARMPLTLQHGQASVNAVAWRQVPGEFPELFAGGGLSLPDGRHVVRRWPDFRNPDVHHDIPVSRDAIATLEATPNGEIVFAAADPAWGVIGADGAIRYAQRNAGSDNRDISASAFQISDDGSQLEFRFAQNGENSIHRFDAAGLTVDPIDRVSAGGWIAAAPPLGLEGWRNRSEVTLNGTPVPLAEGETARSAHQTPDGRILLGADFTLYLLDLSGRVLKSLPLESAAFGVVATRNSDRAVVALADGSFRWHSLAPGRELEEIGAFYFTQGGQWVSWLPNGRFAHSSNGGEELVGYHLNRGADAEAEWIDLGRLYDTYYEPGAVQVEIGRVPEAVLPAPVQALDLTAPELVTNRLPPEIEITEFCYRAPEDGAERCADAALLSRSVVRVSDAAADAGQPPSGGVFTVPPKVVNAKIKMKIKIEGRPKEAYIKVNDTRVGGATRRVQRVEDTTSTDDGRLEISAEREFRLSEGRNLIEAFVDDGFIDGSSQTIVVEADPYADDRPPSILHALVVGVNEYDTIEPKLGAARKDAERFAQLLQENRGDEYEGRPRHVVDGWRCDGREHLDGDRTDRRGRDDRRFRHDLPGGPRRSGRRRSLLLSARRRAQRSFAEWFRSERGRIDRQPPGD